MKYSDQSYNIHIELDTENCELTAAEIEHLERGLSTLREPVEEFPVANLYLTIEFKPPSQHYRVKAALRLPGQGLATGDVDEEIFPAYRRCINKLVHKVSAYKERLEDAEAQAKHEKGTRHDVIASRIVDSEALRRAVEQSDYVEFRRRTYPFEEAVRKRAGRWIQRYPTVESHLGERFDLADIVEEVFLNAFERFDEHPREVPFGDWLEGLIDPSIKLLLRDPEGELENVSFARSAMDAERDQQADT